MTQHFVLNPPIDCIYSPRLMHFAVILFSRCSFVYNADVFVGNLILEMWSWGNCSLMLAPVWQACKISVNITSWQQRADISISHVTAWNNPVKNILQSILMTFCSPQSHKVIKVGTRTLSTFRSLWCNFNDVSNHWQRVQFPGFILSCSRWNRWNTEICFCLSLSEPLIQPM